MKNRTQSQLGRAREGPAETARVRRPFGLAAILLLVLTRTQVALAQEPYPISNAHVLEHQTATELVQRGRAAAEKGDWSKACSYYQEALERYPDHVVPVGDGVYQGLADHVSRALAAFPEAGQKVYRDIYDPRASVAFKAALELRDAEALLAAARSFPSASDSPRALTVAAAILAERGDVSGALNALRATDETEALQRLSADALAYLAVALRVAGSSDGVGRLAAALAADRTKSGRKVRVSGKEVSLAALLKELLRAPPQRGATPGTDPSSDPGRNRDKKPASPYEWSHFFGAPARDGTMPALSSLPPMAWKQSIPVGAERVIQSVSGWLDGMSEEPDTRATQRAVHYPVVGLGSVFLHNDLSVFAYSIVGPDRRLLWKHENTRLSTAEVMDDERVDHTSTLWKGRLFANIVTHVGEHETRLGWLTVKYPLPRRALLAFDARTGQVLWQVGGEPGSPPFPGAASFPHAPATVDDFLYVGGTHALYTTTPPDHYVFCLDAAGGKMRWNTFISSAVLDINLFNNPTREVVGTPVTVWQNLVFYCTNVGVLAALDKATGRIVWLRKYPHVPTYVPRTALVPPRRPFLWCNNPLLVADGKLVVTPMDSPYIFLFDAKTGKELAKRQRDELRSECGAGDFRYLLGVHEGSVFVSCPHCVVALSVKKQPYLSAVWRCNLGSENAFGRGALSDGAVIVPGMRQLLKLDAETGKILDRWPWQFPGGEQFGSNIVITPTVVFAAFSQSLRAFYSTQVLEQALAEELAAAPNDPEVIYRVGMSYLRTQKKPEGISLLEKAAAIAGKMRGDRESRALEQRCKQSLFEVYMESAETADRVGSPTARAGFETAKRWAPDGEKWVVAAFRLAKSLTAAGALAEAVAQFSEVIGRYPDAQYESLRAADFAQGEISKLVAAHDRSVFAAIEKQAAAQLEAARKSGLHEKYLLVFKLYPNSGAAEAALLDDARNASKTRRWDDVIEAMQIFLRHYQNSGAALEAQMLLLGAYEAKEMLAAARSVLRSMTQRFPDKEIGGTGVPPVVIHGQDAHATTTTDGAKQTVREFVQARLDSELYRGKQPAGAAASALAPPLAVAWRHTSSRGTDLRVLMPRPAELTGAPMHPDVADKAFFATADTIICLSTLTGALQWELPVAAGVARSRPLSPCLHDRYLVIASANQLLAVNVVAGMEAWSRTLDNYINLLTLCDGLVYSAVFVKEGAGDMRLFAFDANTGATVWEQPVVQQRVDQMLVVGDYLVLYAPQLPVVSVYNRISGAFERRIQLGGRVNSIVPGLPDTIIAVTTDLKAREISLTTGVERWVQPLGPVAEVGQKFATTEELLVYFQQGMPGNKLALIDLSSGKMRLRREVPTDGLQRGWWLVDGMVYSAYVDRNRGIPYVQAMELLEGEVRMQFSPETAHRNSEMRPAPSGKFLIFNCPIAEASLPPEPTRWAPNVYIVEKQTGKVAQALGKAELEPSPTAPQVYVLGGTLIVHQGDTVTGFTGKK